MENLYNLIHASKFETGTHELTESQKTDIVNMVGKGCRANTKERLARIIELPLSIWQKHGIYSRITLNAEGAEYICGQSWPDEMRTLRDCILNK